MPCVDTNANTKMAEAEKNGSSEERHVRVTFIVCQARNCKGGGIVYQKESGKSSLLRSVKSRIIQGLGELSFVD